MLFSLAATSLVLIVGYLASPPTAPQGAVPAPGSTTGQPDDGFSSASLSESGDCYFVRGFGLPTVPPDPSPAAAVHGSTCRWVEVTRAQLDSLMDRRVCAFSGSSGPFATIAHMTRRYDASEIEPKWQQVWADEGLYRASDDPDDPRPRFYALDMFPYPSGDLHMGHAEAFSGGDAVARYRRCAGYNVLHPIGWDAFGLPAENAAIKRGIPPKEWTYANIEQQAASFQRMGMSFDWSRRLDTCDPEYYRWTQWLFLRFFDKGLAYRKNSPVNWCPHDQTVLANEQVIEGACERCGTMVERRDLTQWFYKITDYAQRLLDDMDDLDRLARARPDDAAQLDRAQRGRAGHVHDRRDRRGDRGLHDAPRHVVGRHVLRVRGRASGGGAAGELGGTGIEVERRCASRPGPPR